MNARDEGLIRAQHRRQADLLMRRAGGHRDAKDQIVYPLLPGERERFPDPRPVVRVVCPRCCGTGVIDRYVHWDYRPQQCACDRGFVERYAK